MSLALIWATEMVMLFTVKGDAPGGKAGWPVGWNEGPG